MDQCITIVDEIIGFHMSVLQQTRTMKPTDLESGLTPSTANSSIKIAKMSLGTFDFGSSQSFKPKNEMYDIAILQSTETLHINPTFWPNKNGVDVV